MSDGKRPVLSALGMLAGALLLLDALAWDLDGPRGLAAIAHWYFTTLFPTGGALVIIASALLWSRPRRRVSLGLVILLCSLYSGVFVGFLGLAGMLLGLLVGALAILLKGEVVTASLIRVRASPRT